MAKKDEALRLKVLEYLEPGQWAKRSAITAAVGPCLNALRWLRVACAVVKRFGTHYDYQITDRGREMLRRGSTSAETE